MSVLKGIGYAFAACIIVALVLGGGLILFLLALAIGAILRVGFIIFLVAIGLKCWWETRNASS